MSDQTAERAHGPRRRRLPAIARRAARSTESVIRSDPLKLKVGLEGIRDWTARLPGLLDAPRWRAPLPDLTDISPGWRRHDRTHLEINLEHPTIADGRTWEAWIFLPESFRLGPDTYSTQRIGADIQSRVRFSAPELLLSDVGGAAGNAAAMVRSSDAAVANDELKVFACSVREAVARATLDVRMADSTEAMTAGAEVLVDTVESAITSIRETVLPAAERAGPSVAETAGWVDEHLSEVIETAMVKLVKDLSRRKSAAPVVARLTQVAVNEARHRTSFTDEPSVSSDSSTFELEQVERRRHALKRLTSSVLWLELEAGDARSKAEHTLHSVAAGIAMTFAVAAALWYGTPNDATDLWVWGGLAVLAYMGKDRLKAMLQDAFTGYIDKRYPNRKWTIRHGASELEVATGEEKYRFVGPDELPPDVARFRRDLQRDSLGETLELDSILHHRKRIVVAADAVRAVDQRVESLTEILRIDVARWLTHTDDPSRSVTMADPESGELFKSSLPRAYDVTILHRLSPTGVDTNWSAARVVLSRKGIRRVDQLDP